jgi:phage terminase large subunit
MSAENERLRQYDLKHFPNDYENIWEGKPRTVVAGAIYSREVIEMMTEKRFRPIPYEPRLPVHRIWDLGWNDLMTVVMVQKPHPSALNVINYLEDSHITYAAMLATLDRLNYKWGDDWLPHDASQHHPTSGTNARKQIQQLTGRVPKDIPRSDPEARIRAARMMWPRVYVDNSKHDTPTDRPDRLLGAAHLVDRLKTYKRNIPRSTNEPTGPTHDISSHGSDAFGGLAEIVDRIRNEGDMPEVKIAPFRNADASMGLLG